MWRRWNLVPCWWECEAGPLLWRTGWRFLKNIKNRIPMGSRNSALGCLLKELKAGSQRNICIRIHLLELLWQSSTELGDFLSSPFWGLEVRNQGVGRVGVFWGLFLTCRWLSSVCVFIWSSFCVGVLIISSSRTVATLHQGPPIWPHFNSVETLSPKTVTFWGSGSYNFNLWLWAVMGETYFNTYVHSSSPGLRGRRDPSVHWWLNE